MGYFDDGLKFNCGSLGYPRGGMSSAPEKKLRTIPRVTAVNMKVNNNHCHARITKPLISYVMYYSITYYTIMHCRSKGSFRYRVTHCLCHYNYCRQCTLLALLVQELMSLWLWPHSNTILLEIQHLVMGHIYTGTHKSGAHLRALTLLHIQLLSVV